MEGEALRTIWANGCFDRFNLCTQTGQALFVRFPGRYRPGPLPHFAGASLELDGELILGDVAVLGDSELPNLQQWARHFPFQRPALLVAYRHTTGLRREALRVPVLELSGKICKASANARLHDAITAGNMRLPAYICN